MKKAIISTLCSGLVIPGLGQILNQDLKKGLLILSGIFLLFVAGIIKLVRLFNAVFRSGSTDISDPQMILNRLRTEDMTLLWILAALFFLLWIYSVIDAYMGGMRMDQAEERSLRP